MYYSKFLRSSDFNWSLNCKLIFNHLLEFKKTFSVYTDRVAIIKKKGGVTIKIRITPIVYVPYPSLKSSHCINFYVRTYNDVVKGYVLNILLEKQVRKYVGYNI